MTMKEFAPAKINLFLDVIRKREDGYHDLGTVFQTVDVGDTLEFSARDDGEIHLEYSNPQEYPVESDLVYKAAVALRSHVGNNDLGADIFLDKIMPLGAGLGGGSADAAAALRALNRLWELRLPPAELERIGAKLGADVTQGLAGSFFGLPVDIVSLVMLGLTVLLMVRYKKSPFFVLILMGCIGAVLGV